jgi:hypothetical protein
MGKGFLTKIIDRAFKKAPPPGLQDSDFKQLENNLGQGVVRIADFLDAYRGQGSAGGQEFSVQSPIYFMAVSSLYRQMTEGKTTFHYPEPGTIEYREKDLFMVAHCYLPVQTVLRVAQDLRDAGMHRNAALFTAALKDIQQTGKIAPPHYPAENGYKLESGVHAKEKYTLGLYEDGDALVPVLNIRSDTKNAVPKFRS